MQSLLYVDNIRALMGPIRDVGNQRSRPIVLLHLLFATLADIVMNHPVGPRLEVLQPPGQQCPCPRSQDL